MTTLEGKVRETIRKHEMFSHGDGVLLGVSGGPDSVALLYLMSILRGEYGLRLAVAHLIHGIRGEEAKKDAQFVAEMAERLAIPVHLKEVGLPRMKMEEGKGNLEAMGRKERYGFFATVAEQCGLNKVATAHTVDDQAETLLMWLLRGSGRRGLSGMPPMRKLTPPGPGKTTPWLVRPLIEASRQEIMDYITEHGLEYRTDQTNLDVRPLRNWIRHRLLPQFRERIDSRVGERLARLAEILRDEERVLDRIARGGLERLGHDRHLMRRALLQEDKAVQRRIIRTWLESSLGNLCGFTFDHVEAIRDFVVQSPPNGRISLPGGWKLVRQYGAFRLVRREPRKVKPVCYSYILPLEGELVIPEAGVKLQSLKCSSSSLPRPRDNLEALFDFADVPADAFTVRNFRPGDQFQPLGMNGHKKVKDLFIEKKVPPPERRTLPLILRGDEIVWIPQYGRSNVAKTGSQTKEILRVRLTFLHV
jgi:tRNA(Ile)-lysidine synthase